MKPIRDSIRAIAANRTSGASELAVQALQVLKQAVISSDAPDVDSLSRDLSEVSEALAGCRPAMAAVYNCARRFHEQLLICAGRAETLEELRSCCLTALEQLEIEIRANQSSSIMNAANYINSGMILATCSYSSTFIAAIHTAFRQGKKPSVRILQSQAGTINYGQQTQLALEADGLDCQMGPDGLAPEFMEGVDLVLLGADAVFRDGSVLNGYPSLKLATAAAAHTPPIPVVVICDSLKFCLDHKLNLTETGFEVIPHNLVSGLITEDGVFMGAAIINYLASQIR